MAGGTGVGGIKDSQGNFEIIGKDSGSVGTRGGTFVMPIGDVSAQTPGALSVNVFTATTLHSAQAISLNVVAFTPGVPPAPPTIDGTRMAFTAGLDATGGYGVFHLGKPDAGQASGLSYGLFEDRFTLGLPPAALTRTVIGVETDVVLLNAAEAFPNTPNGLNASALEAIFPILSPGADAGGLSFDAPCDGYITDIMALILSAGDITFEIEGDLTCTLPNVPGETVRRATTISRATIGDPVVLFAKGETFTITFPVSNPGTQPLVKISYVRTGSVL